MVMQAAILNAFTQESTEDSPIQHSPHYQITAVHYNIKGITKQYPLSRAVPIDKARIFNSLEELQHYITELKQRLKNIRAIQSAEIQEEYGVPTETNLIPVTLTIAISDTWNFIALPYPSFDSNSGFQVKLKMQDFNFAGTLQPLKADITYRSTTSQQSLFSSSLYFSLPFNAKIFDMLWNTSFEIIYAHKKVPKINIASGLQASYTVNKRFSVIFGIMPELVINDRDSTGKSSKPSENVPKPPQSGNQNPPTQESPSTENSADSAETERMPSEDQTPDILGYLYPRDRYYFKTSFYVFTPVVLTEVKHFGALVWSPAMNLFGNWAFDGLQAEQLKHWSFDWSHTLSLSKVNWISNFRKGLSFSLGNTYSYRFYKRKNLDIAFTASITGYYSFFDRVGIYGRMQYFYHLFNASSIQAGTALRGILNKRINTDTGFTFNLDIPIRIATVDFQAITGVDWTRYLNCEIQIAPFLDIAFVHDKKTGRYYHPTDGWYAGGVELIVYPQKMRSIYVRASAGFDLSELKNVPGMNKISGRAKRDGESITEIFIGIGVHY